ncbi:hypothetical protein Y032_0175g526 [Ancylostoma ceylanicum]|uniref:Uncharacterized protein n=1 Tax=Ancylostoma ceylanicum TaxID=53326 RepID=A0A016STY6_9BILA|nr:hypothetical protein Y032_0175g526 [Ancylostoma ceylanicum]
MAFFLQFVVPSSIHLSCQSLKASLFLPSAARTFEGCSCHADMNRPITAQQRTSRHAACLDSLGPDKI